MGPKPIEFAIEDAKVQIVRKINEVSEQSQLPGIIITMILQQILDESKLAAYSTYISQVEYSPENESTEPPVREIHVDANDIAQQLADQPAVEE